MNLPFTGGNITALDRFNALTAKIGDASGKTEQPAQQDSNGQIYWYVYCLRQGKNALLGPYATQPEAAKAAQDKVSGWSYRVIGFRTRNRAAAVQMLKHDIANGGQIGKAIAAMRHSV